MNITAGPYINEGLLVTGHMPDSTSRLRLTLVIYTHTNLMASEVE